MAGRIMIVSGEVSGDMYGGRLARALNEIAPGTILTGIGGDSMTRAGVQLLAHINELSVMGFWEVLRDVGRLRKILKRAKESLRQTKPDGLIIIDFYRFNIELAREARRLGIPVVYYVAPKLWVWGKGRIRKLRENVDRILAIFPFEEEYYRSRGMPVSYVGNPLMEIMADPSDGGRDRTIDIREGETVVSLLPGSRMSEVRQLLPHFLGAAKLISRGLNVEVKFYLPLPQTISRSLVEDMIHQAGVKVTIIEGMSRDVLRISDVALVASGTATLEAFLLGTPQIVAYRTSWLTYFLGKRFIKIENFSLPNILSGREVVEELLQEEVFPERLAGLAMKLLDENEPARVRYIEAGQEVLAALKGDMASKLAATSCMEVFGRDTG